MEQTKVQRLAKTLRVLVRIAFVCNLIALFFVPAGVGLMTSFDLISRYWAALLVIISITTWLIIAVVGWIEETMEKKNI